MDGEQPVAVPEEVAQRRFAELRPKRVVGDRRPRAGLAQAGELGGERSNLPFELDDSVVRHRHAPLFLMAAWYPRCFPDSASRMEIVNGDPATSPWLRFAASREIAIRSAFRPAFTTTNRVATRRSR